jgi:hypothetical protein
MTAETHIQVASFIWSICNLLRGPYKRNEYRKVILLYEVIKAFARLDLSSAQVDNVQMGYVSPYSPARRLSERDETADICTDTRGKPEPDADLRDTENVPAERRSKTTSSAKSSRTSPMRGSTKAKPGSVTRSRSIATFTATNRSGRWKRSSPISKRWKARFSRCSNRFAYDPFDL